MGLVRKEKGRFVLLSLFFLFYFFYENTGLYPKITVTRLCAGYTVSYLHSELCGSGCVEKIGSKTWDEGGKKLRVHLILKALNESQALRAKRQEYEQ